MAYSKPDIFQKKLQKGVISAFIKDSIPVEIDLSFDTDSLPDVYSSYIESPVCEDGICYELKVHLYWDILGNFLKYEEVDSDPFTKFEHDLFTPKDHVKLQEILADKTSPLANYAPVDLIDKNKSVYSSVIDGMAGATYPALKSKVVEGAVYSTHTLWNIVNGSIADSIQRHTSSIMNENLLVKMIHSDRYPLQMYGMRNISPDNANYADLLLELVENGQEYVPFFAIAKLTPSMWANPGIQARLIKLTGNQNFEMQNEVLNGLATTQLAPGNTNKLLAQIPAFAENQYKKLYDVINGSTSAFSKEDWAKLKTISMSDGPFYSFAKRVLEKN